MMDYTLNPFVRNYGRAWESPIYETSASRNDGYNIDGAWKSGLATQEVKQIVQPKEEEMRSLLNIRNLFHWYITNGVKQ